jgi:hypothetical protein
VLLGVKTDHERGDVDDLLADADVTLLDEDTGVVDGLGETELVDTSLETTLKEILDLEGKDVIELHAGLVEHTDADKTANESISFEQTLGVLLVEGEELTVRREKLAPCLPIMPCPIVWRFHKLFFHIPSSTTDLGEGELDTPHLTLVAQAVLADNLEFRVTSKMIRDLNTT